MELTVLAASTLSDMCQREYLLTVGANKKKLPLRNKVSFALDEWTSTNKQVITSITAYNIDQNWALQEVQLAFDVSDSLFSSFFDI